MKLYVIVRTDIPWIHQAVQAGHAVAQFLLENPKTSWKNGTLVYLRAGNQDSLMRWHQEFTERHVVFAEFREPDLGNELTALAAVGVDKLVKGFPTL